MFFTEHRSQLKLNNARDRPALRLTMTQPCVTLSLHAHYELQS